jgi:hypothetical protein
VATASEERWAGRSTTVASWEREGMGVKVMSRQKQKGLRVALGSLSKPGEVSLGGQNLLLLIKVLRFRVKVHYECFLKGTKK